ncbi:type II secretion system protein GspL [Ideonella livida]|uniref:General secretion pathway protein GspL n=1 Tax=Ideonella livida TaxID=2707176 RepID=A0A7C9PIE3_9BURK|nr:type II secretion system protein GspL [Ideonella livida]NDY92777.1 general secretion pathway protein GspL [Ideonella livida]
MSILLVQLPARARTAAHLAPAPAAQPADETPELDWTLCDDSLQPQHSGRSPVAGLPEATSRVAVLDPRDVAWHPLQSWPKAPPARLRAALQGLLEESLADETDDLHLALSPREQAGPDAPVWVASTQRSWLAHWIGQLETEQQSLARIVPAWAPGEGLSAHVWTEGGQAWLLWRDARGPLCLPADSAMARQLVHQAQAPQADGSTPTIEWSGQGAGAEVAARLAGAPVEAHALAERLTQAAAGAWNLRQFDLAPRHRRDRALRALGQRLWHDPAGRWARRGLLGLVLVQLVGANLWAWQQRHALTQRTQSLTQTLQAAFPQVRAIFDPPAQMQRELDLLRAAAGRPGETDLEPLLQAADQAWPPQRGPAEQLRFEPGRLQLSATGWSAEELQAFRSQLWPLGLDAESPSPGQVVVSRLRGPLPTLPAPAGPQAPAGARPPGGPGAPPGPGAMAPGVRGPGLAPPGTVPGTARPLPPGGVSAAHSTLPGARPADEEDQ